MNPYVYDDLCLLDPLIEKLSDQIQKNNFPLYNQFVCDENHFEFGVLTDEMHIGDLGWYRTNKFIIENYY